ncbi:hypothetical protein [Shinella sp.]|uniref:hypothetical protein n=1 Tax=Shinella sp. TaxID=1870904 RepID=UPI00301D0F32
MCPLEIRHENTSEIGEALAWHAADARAAITTLLADCAYPLEWIAEKLSCSACMRARRPRAHIELNLYKLPR